MQSNAWSTQSYFPPCQARLLDCTLDPIMPYRQCRRSPGQQSWAVLAAIPSTDRTHSRGNAVPAVTTLQAPHPRRLAAAVPFSPLSALWAPHRTRPAAVAEVPPLLPPFIPTPKEAASSATILPIENPRADRAHSGDSASNSMQALSAMGLAVSGSSQPQGTTSGYTFN